MSAHDCIKVLKKTLKCDKLNKLKVCDAIIMKYVSKLPYIG